MNEEQRKIAEQFLDAISDHADFKLIHLGFNGLDTISVGNMKAILNAAITDYQSNPTLEILTP